MSGLEQTFYIMAIIYMAVMFLAMLATVAAILTIRAKINAIERNIEEKFHAVAAVAHVGEEIISHTKRLFGK